MAAASCPSSSLRVATKQSSVLFFNEALAHACWIASSLTLLAMTGLNPPHRAFFVIASGNEAIQRPLF
jgi:hypothetical protein